MPRRIHALILLALVALLTLLSVPALRLASEDPPDWIWHYKPGFGPC